jgi:superfamily I DNA/RNA helicase
MEFACKLSGAKVIFVIGHTGCGAIKGAIDNAERGNLIRSGRHSPMARGRRAASATHQVKNVLDYDDLLLYWAQMVSDPGLAGEIGARIDHVLVDEYQDTNRLQASILLALKPGGRGLTDVGDDAQSIYSFRAATVRNILDFPGQFSPPAEIITLDRNYRSTPPTASSISRVSASPKISGPTAPPRSGRNSSPFATRTARLTTSSRACWRTAKAAPC